MKNYEKVVELGCFSLGELAEKLNCCIPTATSLIQKYLKNGYIERVRRDLYATISIETKQPILTRYQIGSKLFDDAYLSHHTAFEVYGYANQVFYEAYVATNTRFADFTYDGVLYHRTSPKTNILVNKINDTKVSSVEQTVIDSISDMEKIAGLEEILRCILLIPSLNAEKLLDAIKKCNNGFVFQKCGYIFEQLNSTLHLPESFFDECAKHISNSKRYLTKEHTNYIWYEKWKLYAPENIYTIIDKGVNNYN
ncbi:MAG: transcriptional regulator [Clostridia bacterium]|nr:transcriptional regulator [Clostridia bacterium]